jgi:hypothetical protein
MKIVARTKRWWFLGLILAVVAVAFTAWAGRLLVVDNPQGSDIIVVLAGETDRRPERALELLDQGYARRVLIDVPDRARVYDSTVVQLAEDYIRRRPEAAKVGICPIRGLSTRDESHDVIRCLAREQGARILIVTSDFHTRRSLSIFRHEIPGKSFSVAAARDDSEFGTRWWMHRQWAKTCVDEWLRLLWWSAIERWL